MGGGGGSFASTKSDTSVISRTVCFKFTVVYGGIKTYGPIMTTLTQPHEKSTLGCSGAVFHSVTLPNVRTFDDRACLRFLKPDSAARCLETSVERTVRLPRGFCWKSNKIKARTSPRETVLFHHTRRKSSSLEALKKQTKTETWWRKEKVSRQ